VGKWQFAGTAREQVTAIIRRSELDWGAPAADRYLALLLTAMQDVADDPQRPGSRQIDPNLLVYHIRHSRNRVPDPPGRVRSPRHYLVYGPIGPDLVSIYGLFFDRIPPRIGVRRVFGEL